MSRLVVQDLKSEKATAIVAFGPGQPVQFGAEDRLISGVVKPEGPLPLSALVRQVLSRYGLEPTAETDCAPHEEDDAVWSATDRQTLRA